jgi:threonine dehydrogenase-like Zn-dependent dehydrogenase
MIEPLACVLNNLAAAAARPDDDVLIAGAGPIGTLCGLVLAARGARPRLFDRDRIRVAHARAALGPDARVVMNDHGRLSDALDNAPDVVIDTTGLLLEQALEVVADAGRVVVMGEHDGARALVAPRSIVTRGISIVGAGPYAPEHFEQAIELACDLPLESVVSHAFALDRYEDAFALLGVGHREGAGAAGYGAMKVLLASGTGPLET